MKIIKTLTILALAILFVCCASTLVACVEKPFPQDLTDLTMPALKDNQVAVIIKNGQSDYTNYIVTLTQDMTTVEHVLQYLNDNGMRLDWTDSQYGKTINAIGKITPSATQNQFVAFFTSVEADKGNWAGVPTYVIGDVQVASAQVGVSQATVENGAVFYFEMSTY